MSIEDLKKILEAEEKEEVLFNEKLKPALDRLEHAEDLLAERSHIGKLVVGTPFEKTFNALNFTKDSMQELYKLNHMFQEQMRTDHDQRREELEEVLKRTPQPQLTPRELYYVAYHYSKGGTLQDSEQADHYLNLALKMQPTPFTAKVKELYAENYDHLQLRKTPPQPQKYGTVYADHNDVAKGLEKNHLIAPNQGYQYNIMNLNQARQALGLKMLNEQVLNTNSQSSPLKPGMRPIPGMNVSAEKEKEKAAERKAPKSQVTCTNCGRVGHIAIGCINPKKQ